ncbi:Uma2 family endonuclease [Streptomyces sp. NPDC127098]|uniref:Uma2 family endonuclease n=1 Tax=Streptomyces sp. NPDC127098 TaxID=3347137 RepID=UPI00364EAB48
MGVLMTERPQEIQATSDNWWCPPEEGWTYDQVKDVELPFDWELVDGVIVVRGQTPHWHDMVKGEIFRALSSAGPKAYAVRVETCVLVDERNVIKPDVVVFEKRGLDPFTMECVPVASVRLAVEVVSPGSKRRDQWLKPAILVEAGVPHYWRVERDRENLPVVHEYRIDPDTGAYIPAHEYAIHREKLSAEKPFPIDIDLRALIEF